MDHEDPRFAGVLALVRSARQGSQEAMEELLRRYMPLILKETRRFRHAENTDVCLSTEDVRQEAVLQLIQLVKEYSESSGACFGSYLKQKLRWRLHNYLRRERRRALTTIGLDCPEVEQLASELDHVVEFDLDNPRLRSAFRRLSPRQRLVLAKMFWQDKTVREIAAELRVTPQAIGALHRRALRQLRKRM